MPKSGPAPRFPDATAANPHKTHASNENSLEGPCWVRIRDTLKAHILLSNFLWENFQLSNRSEPKGNYKSFVLYLLALSCFFLLQFELLQLLSKTIYTLVPMATVSFFQPFQEVDCVGFLSRQSKMRVSTIFIFPQDLVQCSLMSNENYV